jgi:glycosyltransferase involved in cell wall biosynthesis
MTFVNGTHGAALDGCWPMASKAIRLQSRTTDLAIVYQAPWNWDFLRNRAQPLAEALGKRARVVYVEPGVRAALPLPATLQSLAARVSAIAAHRLLRTFAPVPGVTVVQWVGIRANPWEAVAKDYGEAQEQRMREFLAPIRSKCRKMIYLTSRPATAWWSRLDCWDLVAVDFEDPWFSSSWMNPENERLTVDLLHRADVVVANGARLSLEYEKRFQRSILSLPNGVDSSLVARLGGQPPVRKAKGERPIALFLGNINERIDYELLYEAALRSPSWKFLFVGPVTIAPTGKVRQFFGLPNVERRQPISHEAVPGYLTQADCLLLPYKNAGSHLMFPSKILEYWAAGKPIVATMNFEPDDMNIPGLSVCTNAEETIAALEAIESAPADGCLADECRRMAQGHSWEVRANRLLLAFDEALNTRC